MKYYSASSNIHYNLQHLKNYWQLQETKKQRAYRALCETYDFVVDFLGTENDEALKKWNDQNPVKGNYHLCDYLKSRIEKF